MQENQTRRQFIKVAGAALAAIPVLAFTGSAQAATNAAMRAAMKYQATPIGDKHCGNCIQFVPGSTATASGGCKIFPGDTEIAPQAACVAWAAMPKK